MGFNFLRNMRQPGFAWPPLDQEFGQYRSYFKGKVLNAGAGNRDISSMVDGELVNQDLAYGQHNANINIFSPLHQIPVADDYFNAVVCNAVLEHVANPVEVIHEFFRVIKPGGYLFLCIPFLQPEHLDPTDFQRYTKDGLCKLVTDQGFEVEKVEGVHNVYITLIWIVQEWLESKRTLSYALMRTVFYPILRHKARSSSTYVHRIASAYRVLACKPIVQTATEPEQSS